MPIKRVSPPHPIPYQGSKRKLADTIFKYAPEFVETLYEPFAGSAAISIFAAHNSKASKFVIGDSFPELMGLWDFIINDPQKIIAGYNAVWLGQQNGDPNYFNKVRSEFNEDRDPIKLLYLIARCVKNAVRFNSKGDFTQSSDKRRLGTNPNKMEKSIMEVHMLLKDKTELFVGDYFDCIEKATEKDLVYMDPPYQGTTYGNDKRYFDQLEKEHLYETLTELNRRNVPFLLSYDGYCGEKAYGEELPSSIRTKRVLLNAGRSSQATLSGKNSVTFESLYISENLVDLLGEYIDEEDSEDRVAIFA